MSDPATTPAPTRSAANLAAAGWGLVYASWAGLKFIAGLAPTMCLRPPMADVANVMSLWELALGIAVVLPASRRVGSLLAVATHLGLILFAFIAHFQGHPYEDCGCVFVGIEFPWLPGHALLAAALLVPFLAIFVREEKRHRRARTHPQSGTR